MILEIRYHSCLNLFPKQNNQDTKGKLKESSLYFLPVFLDMAPFLKAANRSKFAGKIPAMFGLGPKIGTNRKNLSVPLQTAHHCQSRFFQVLCPAFPTDFHLSIEGKGHWAHY